MRLVLEVADEEAVEVLQLMRELHDLLSELRESRVNVSSSQQEAPEDPPK